MMLGLKGLTWGSVIIPDVAPKPDLVALTNGYSKTPVLQIGADIYCDTRRIADELEAKFPHPRCFRRRPRDRRRARVLGDGALTLGGRPLPDRQIA